MFLFFAPGPLFHMFLFFAPGPLFHIFLFFAPGPLFHIFLFFSRRASIFTFSCFSRRASSFTFSCFSRRAPCFTFSCFSHQVPCFTFSCFFAPGPLFHIFLFFAPGLLLSHVLVFRARPLAGPEAALLHVLSWRFLVDVLPLLLQVALVRHLMRLGGQGHGGPVIRIVVSVGGRGVPRCGDHWVHVLGVHASPLPPGVPPDQTGVGDRADVAAVRSTGSRLGPSVRVWRRLVSRRVALGIRHFYLAKVVGLFRSFSGFLSTPMTGNKHK